MPKRKLPDVLNEEVALREQIKYDRHIKHKKEERGYFCPFQEMKHNQFYRERGQYEYYGNQCDYRNNTGQNPKRIDCIICRKLYIVSPEDLITAVEDKLKNATKQEVLKRLTLMDTLG